MLLLLGLLRESIITFQDSDGYLTVSVPGGQNKVSQSQIHCWVARKFRKFIKLIQLHHIRPYTQGFTAFIWLVKGLEIRTQTWDWRKDKITKYLLKLYKTKKNITPSLEMLSVFHTQQTYFVAVQLCSDPPSVCSETRCWKNLRDSFQHSLGNRQ